MSRVATRRLLDASATLDAADRALLNIWLNRGLDDVALARMTGLDVATVVARRVRIVTHLSATLGLPPETIRGALDEIVASAEARPIAEVATPSVNGATLPATVTPSADFPAPPATVASSADFPAPPPSGGTPRTKSATSAAEAPAGDSASPRRRWLWGLPLTAIVVAVVLIVLLGSGGSGRHTNHPPHRAPGTARVAGSAVPAGTASPAPPSPTGTAARPDPLVALAGGPAHAAGTALVTGKRSHLRLQLSISNLPPASHGHYEIWLYDSIIYARDLGRLRNGVSHLSLRLPPNAPRFRWIDISLQPPGVVFHSGGSLLRSANPLFTKAGARRPS